MPSNYKTVINFRDGIQVDTDDLISNNGLVGIGSTIPRQQLDVRGNVIVDNLTELNDLTVTGVATYYGTLNVGTGSSVGIGTTVPEAAFQVGVGTTGFTVTEGGVVRATEYFGSGANLVDLPVSVWINPGAGDTIYSLKDVGVGTERPRGGADFGVGFEIFMDANSGVGTFEGLVAKNITAVNASGQGQGTVVADVGTFSTVTATSTVEAPTFIGTITNATRAVVAAGLTDSPSVRVTDIQGVGGTFTGITSFQTLRISGGVVAEAGVITATTFSGTATTAIGAQTAFSLLGQPEILVDLVTVDGIAPSIIRGSGVSTIGQDLLVGEFIGVGNTSSAIGEAAGFIGTVRVHQGDLIVDGSVGIAGSITGSLNIGAETDIDVLNVGAGLSVAGISSFTGTVTGAGDMVFQGDITCDELNTSNGMTVGGGFTCGSLSCVNGGVTAQGRGDFTGGGQFLGGGVVVGGGLTIGGPIIFSTGGSISTTGVDIQSGVLTCGAVNFSSGGGLGKLGIDVAGAAVTCGKIFSSGGAEYVEGIVVGASVTMNGQLFGVNGGITGAGFCTMTAGFQGDKATIGAGGLTVSGVSTVQDLNVDGSLTVSGVGTIDVGSAKVDGVTGLITGTKFIGFAGVSTFNDIKISSGNDTEVFGKYIGLGIGANTLGISSRVASGLQISGTSELFIDTNNEGKGIGIGTTSGDRAATDLLHVGLLRETNGKLINTQSIFEGNVGIGTTNTRMSGNGDPQVDIYSQILIRNNHLGIGGTIGVGGSTTNRVGFNTDQPGGSLDMRYAGEAFVLPRNYVPSGGVPGNPSIVDVNDEDYEGSMWYDGHTKKFRVRFEDSQSVGLSTELDYNVLEERGFLGRLIENENQKVTDEPTAPPEQPPGWSTSNMIYYRPTDQVQVYGSDSVWRSLVGSATTGVSIIVNGSNLSIDVAGVGSATLSLT
tara:strand:- start:2661 stop:5477 length:2817 start_codon:yes stop_codon:yes gene_type:complete